jgi:hypothetical protein
LKNDYQLQKEAQEWFNPKEQILFQQNQEALGLLDHMP